MRILLIAAMVLMPVLSCAGTNCHVIESSDNFVAECVGDEKAIPASDVPLTVSNQRGVKQQPVLQDQSQLSASSPTTPLRSATAPPTAPPAPQAPVSQGGVVHRQGRQQYQKGLEDAKAARDQLIMQQQEQQSR